MTEKIDGGITESEAVRRIKAGADFAVTMVKGGTPKTTYWTPDGTMIRQIPQLRDFVRKDKDGKVIEQGTRDANLDNGWLLQKPTVLIPQCPYCGRWHNTQAETDVCKIQQGKKDEELGKVVEADIKTELASKDDRIIELELKVEALIKLVEKAIGGAPRENSLMK